MHAKTLVRAVLAVLLLLASAAQGFADLVYITAPDSGSLEHNYASLGYQATQTTMFGDRIGLAGTGYLDKFTVTLSSWARSEDYGGATTFNQALTMNIYASGIGNSPGALLGSVTQKFDVFYRPTGWDRNGIAQNVTFDFSSLGLFLPSEIVYGMSFDTQSWGSSPTGVPGPYNSLNFALDGILTAGSDLDPNSVFWQTATASNYTDGGVGGVNTFRLDTNWSPYKPMVRIETTQFSAAAVPLPPAAWSGLGAFAILGLVVYFKRRGLALPPSC